jgi:predicted RNase H-like HicB family nuclease
MSNRRRFAVVLEPEEDDGYSVHCPALPGCVSQGDTREEALENIQEAILLILGVMDEDGTPVPVETPEVISEEIRQILKAREEDSLPLTVETVQVELPSEVPV